MADPGLGLLDDNLDEFLASPMAVEEWNVALIDVTPTALSSAEVDLPLEPERFVESPVEMGMEGPMLIVTPPIQTREEGRCQTTRATAGKHSNPYHLPRATAIVQNIHLGSGPVNAPDQPSQTQGCPFRPWL